MAYFALTFFNKMLKYKKDRNNMSSKKRNYYLFVDTETTGLNTEYKSYKLRDNKCLEIAYILTDEKFNKIDEKHYIIKSTEEEISLVAKDFIKELTENNLILDSLSSSKTLDEIENNILNDLSKLKKKGNIFLIGNNINFDYEVIRQNFPEIFNILSHKIIDISSIRFAIQLTNRNYITAIHQNKKYKHRANLDVLESYEEFLNYYKYLSKKDKRFKI